MVEPISAYYVEPISAYDVGQMRLQNLKKVQEIMVASQSEEISDEQYINRLRLLFASMQGDLKDIMDSIAVYPSCTPTFMDKIIKRCALQQNRRFKDV